MPRSKQTRRHEVVTGDAAFLVRIGTNFFCGFNGSGQALAIAAPSRARHFNYQDADSTTQMLIAKGYADACVTDLFGRYADLEVLEREVERNRQRMAKFWGADGGVAAAGQSGSRRT